LIYLLCPSSDSILNPDEEQVVLHMKHGANVQRINFFTHDLGHEFVGKDMIIVSFKCGINLKACCKRAKHLVI
jgi:hypothetical protein